MHLLITGYSGVFPFYNYDERTDQCKHSTFAIKDTDIVALIMYRFQLTNTSISAINLDPRLSLSLLNA